MDALTGYAVFETLVKHSRFIAELLPCASQSEARELLKSQKAKYSDASHVVHAFVIGPSAQIRGMSDDGEPSGTAARPVLDVLCGKNCTNALLTVTRWFGGTLLGTGGLVKAYGDAAKAVIEEAERLGAFSELIEKTRFSFTASYAAYEKLRHIMKEFRLFDIAERFESAVSVSGEIESGELQKFSDALRDASGGTVLLHG